MMLDTFKSLLFSIKWHIQRFMDDFSMVRMLALFGAALMCAFIIAFAGLLGMIPMLVLVFLAVYMADKRETNRGKLDRLGETQVTTEDQEKAIVKYLEIPSVKKMREEREREDAK
jgi:hypothetical protein